MAGPSIGKVGSSLSKLVGENFIDELEVDKLKYKLVDDIII